MGGARLVGPVVAVEAVAECEAHDCVEHAARVGVCAMLHDCPMLWMRPDCVCWLLHVWMYIVALAACKVSLLLTACGLCHCVHLQVPAMYQWMQQAGRIADAEMRRTFNMGVGNVMVVSPSQVDAAMQVDPDLFVLGEVVTGSGVSYA